MRRQHGVVDNPTFFPISATGRVLSSWRIVSIFMSIVSSIGVSGKSFFGARATYAEGAHFRGIRDLCIEKNTLFGLLYNNREPILGQDAAAGVNLIGGSQHFGAHMGQQIALCPDGLEFLGKRQIVEMYSGLCAERCAFNEIK